MVIVGAGGHGLATAYYLAAEHGITNVGVLERGWLAGGESGQRRDSINSRGLRFFIGSWTGDLFR